MGILDNPESGGFTPQPLLDPTQQQQLNDSLTPVDPNRYLPGGTTASLEQVAAQRPSYDDIQQALQAHQQLTQQLQGVTQDPQQNLTQQTMQAANAPQRGGVLKRMLTGFAYGFSQAGMKAAGLPTDFDIRQQRLRELEAQQSFQLGQRNTDIAQQNADTNEGYRQFQQNQAAQLIQLPNGVTMPFALAQRVYPELVKQQTALQVAQTKAGMPIALDANTAKLLNMDPSLVGTPLNTYQWGSIQKALAAQGYHVQDLGNEGMWVLDKGGDKVHLITPGSPQLQKANAYAASRAANTPFQTFDNNGNLVTTSQANAIATGAPAASTYNQLYGPTNATKTAGQAANGVASHIDAYQQAVRNLAARGELGAVEGRLNDYLNRGYGGNDPDISNFVMTTKLLKSGTVRAHFGARGGQQVLSSFDQALNTSQEPQAIIGATDAIRNWLNTYGDIGTFKGPKGVIVAGQGANALSKAVNRGNQNNTPPAQSGTFNFNAYPVRKP